MGRSFKGSIGSLNGSFKGILFLLPFAKTLIFLGCSVEVSVGP